MKHYKKNEIYALIAGTAFGLLGCVKEENTQSVQRTLPTKIETREESPYEWDRLTINHNMRTDAIQNHLPVGVACGDLDNDGDLEIIVATSQTIFIYHNNFSENKAKQRKVERD